MSEKAVRTLTSGSNRAKRDGEDRKVVFRSVLDNPFRVQWPPVPVNVQNAVLARILEMLEGVSRYFLDRREQSRKRKREKQGSKALNSKRRKVVSTSPAIEQTDSADVESNTVLETLPPDILKHLTIGINDVTKLLEKCAMTPREGTTEVATSVSEPSSTSVARVVLVCRADVDPPILISHLPHLVAACNSRPRTEGNGDVLLIPLPKGAEYSLASAIGLRRVSVLVIDAAAPNFSLLLSLLDNVPRLSASWLLPQTEATRPTLIPTHIKQLRTTAPKDMKAAKEQRSQKRADAKERKKARGKAGLKQKKVVVLSVPS
ncbi:hypothetical protein OBBRIDRAFT_722113 [Obba rivulosa]|uniref:Uncharacterized protein n=1 Tax=Obba rivulosa TaxID=1052685 RepID=A0A8E2DS91_9APHY|nr:hypothetical protein OBBRIDRAFT_722113 [Obba rivulosa]